MARRRLRYRDGRGPTELHPAPRCRRREGTKTHQMRRIALDSDTVVILRESRERVRARLELLGAPFSESTYLFTGVKTPDQDRKSTRLNSSHMSISYAVFCLKKKKKNTDVIITYNKKKKYQEIRPNKKQTIPHKF